MSEQPQVQRVVLNWTLEREEYVQAVASWTRKRLLGRPGAVRLTVLFLVGLSLAAVLVLTARDPGVAASLLVGLLIWIVVWAGLLVGPMPRWSAVRSWRATPALQRRVEAVLSEAEVSFRTEESESRLLWSVFDAVTDAGHTYRLHIRGQQGFLLIPKRAMPGPDGGEALGALLRRHVGQRHDHGHA